MGGEEALSRGRGGSEAGLPPRGRGRDSVRRSSIRPTRITPAWAGKRAFFVVVSVMTMDYPRVGGEEIINFCKRENLGGLPPRGRGRVFVS